MMKPIFAALITFSILLGGVKAFAAIDRVTVPLKGPCYSFCNMYVMRELEKMKGVIDLEADWERNQANFTWDNLVPFRPWVFKEIAGRAGYNLACIFICASGEIIQNESGYLLHCPASRTRFLLGFCDYKGLALINQFRLPHIFNVEGTVDCQPCRPYRLAVKTITPPIPQLGQFISY